MDNDIVISGIAGRYPECENMEEFWHNLINGIPMYTADDRRWPVGAYLVLVSKREKCFCLDFAVFFLSKWSVEEV